MAVEQVVMSLFAGFFFGLVAISAPRGRAKSLWVMVPLLQAIRPSKDNPNQRRNIIITFFVWWVAVAIGYFMLLRL